MSSGLPPPHLPRRSSNACPCGSSWALPAEGEKSAASQAFAPMTRIFVVSPPRERPRLCAPFF